MRLSLFFTALLLVFAFSTKEGFGNFVTGQDITDADLDSIDFEILIGSRVSGNLALVPSFFVEFPIGGGIILVRDTLTDQWSEDITLSPADGQDFDQYGIGADIDGNTVILSTPTLFAPGVEGAAVIFERGFGGIWTEGPTMKPSIPSSTDDFGVSARISGNVALVSARDDNGNTGAVYVFERQNGVWPSTETQKLTASDGMPGDMFGEAVETDGNTIIASSSIANSNEGKIYVFERNAMGIWEEVQILTPSNPMPNTGFGSGSFTSSITVSGDYIFGGAQGVQVGPNTQQGVVYVFERTNGIWSMNETDTLIGSNGAVNDGFGSTLSSFANMLAVGARSVTATSGRVYIFNLESGNWLETQAIGFEQPSPPSTITWPLDLDLTNGAIVTSGFQDLNDGPTPFIRFLQGTSNVTIITVADPDAEEEFDYEGAGFPGDCELEGEFSMNDDESLSCEVPTNELVVETTGSNGYVLSAINCEGAFLPPVIGPESVTITPLAGENVTCTFAYTLARNVPTLSEWGLLSLAMAIGIIGLFAIRKRKFANIANNKN